MYYLKRKEGTMALIPFTKQDYTIIQGRHPSQMVNATQAFSWIPYFDVTLKATGNITIIAHLILPVDNENQVGDIMASKKIESNSDGSLSISLAIKINHLSIILKTTKQV